MAEDSAGHLDPSSTTPEDAEAQAGPAAQTGTASVVNAAESDTNAAESDTNAADVAVGDEEPPSMATASSPTSSSPARELRNNDLLTLPPMPASLLNYLGSLTAADVVDSSTLANEEKAKGDNGEEGRPLQNLRDESRTLPLLDGPQQLKDDNDADGPPLAPAVLEPMLVRDGANSANNGAEDAPTGRTRDSNSDNVDVGTMRLSPPIAELEQIGASVDNAGSPLLPLTTRASARSSSQSQESNQPPLAGTVPAEQDYHDLLPTAAATAVLSCIGDAPVVAPTPPVVTGRGLETVQDSAPVPAVQTASSYEATEEGANRAKAPDSKPELNGEDVDDEPPAPPAAQIADSLQDVDDHTRDMEKKSKLVHNDEEAPPMRDTQVALQHEDVGAATKSDGDIPSAAPLAMSNKQRAATAPAEDAIERVEIGLDSAPATDEEAPPPPAAPLNNDDAAALEGQAHEQRRDVDYEEQKEEEDGPDDVGEPTPLHIPNAYLVVDEEDGARSPQPPQPAAVDVIDAYAEPLLPWWKQRRTRALFALVFIVALMAAVAVAAAFSINRGEAGTAGAIAVVVVEATAPPSASRTPTLSPTTRRPTSAPTGVPTSTFRPSPPPTACVATVAKERLDLPLNARGEFAALDPLVRVDGRNAAYVAREANTDNVQVVFFRLRDDGQWARVDTFVEVYDELAYAENDILHFTLSGYTAMVGFSLKENESGVVHVYEQQDGGEDGLHWTRMEPLRPYDGGAPLNRFGGWVDSHNDLAVVIAYREMAIYVFRRVSSGGSGRWRQQLKFYTEYEMIACSVRGDVIIMMRSHSAEIHIYRYDRSRNRVVPLQGVLVIDPERREYASLEAQAEATGAATYISHIALSEDHLIYSTGTYNSAEFVWKAKQVFIYQREVGGEENQMFTLQQNFNASDFGDDRFGSELALHRDFLVMGGGDRTFVFAQQENGLFEEIFQYDESFSRIAVSRRNTIAISYENWVYSMDFAACVQQMPTLLPSISAAPSAAPSASGRPTSSAPTAPSTLAPSPVPTSSSVPSKTAIPSHVPTSSSVPTSCYHIRVVIATTGANTEGFENDVTSWELYKERSREVILQGGQFRHDAYEQYEAECVEQDDYLFNITNSGGNGFGECTTCGYYLYVDGRYIGGNSDFLVGDTLRFRLPLYQREVNDNMYIYDGLPVCSGDFFFSLVTGAHPQEITWDVSNEDGETVARGGRYSKAFGAYRDFMCLPDGHFTFTVYNSGEGLNKMANANGYFLYFIGIEWIIIILQSSLLYFNTSESTSFVLGTG